MGTQVRVHDPVGQHGENNMAVFDQWFRKTATTLLEMNIIIVL
jgi:hypothetical protein